MSATENRTSLDCCMCDGHGFCFAYLGGARQSCRATTSHVAFVMEEESSSSGDMTMRSKMDGLVRDLTRLHW